VTLTYNMNILQGLPAPGDVLRDAEPLAAIDPARVIQRIDYEHPIFDQRAVAAQRRHREINGTGGTYYCGAYWRYGFHEDGVVSAMQALAHFETDRLRGSRAA
jgi:uncharacterized protein